MNASSLQDRADQVLHCLLQRYQDPKTNLVAENPWQLLVATILSAQCTDARVNAVTPPFFARWPDARALAGAEVADIEEMIRTVGFYHAKAGYLLATAKKIEADFSGAVPRTLEELMTLSGVARKTANVVLYGAYGINAGFAVDTHVKRISYRLGLTASKDPGTIEKDLMELFPRDTWGGLNHRMVWFGREVCRARNPLCPSCEMQDFCPKIGCT